MKTTDKLHILVKKKEIIWAQIKVFADAANQMQRQINNLAESKGLMENEIRARMDKAQTLAEMIDEIVLIQMKDADK